MTISASEKSIKEMTIPRRKIKKSWRARVFIQKSVINTSVRNVSMLHAAEHNFTLPIGYARRCQPDIRWPHALILHLHLVVEKGVSEHDLELASCEVASRTGMTPVSERQELWGGGNNIKLLTALLEPHFREAETFKPFGVFVRFRVVMCLCRIDTNPSSLRNMGAIRECVILPGNSPHDDCFCQCKTNTGWSGTHDFLAESFPATP